MKQEKNLPDWCRILDGLNSEIAEERSQSKEGHREAYNRNTRLEDKGGVDASLEATTSAHATAVSTIPRKEVPTIEY